MYIPNLNAASDTAFATVAPAFSLDDADAKGTTIYPADFEQFFQVIIEREGATRAPESGGIWSQYGLMTTTVKYYFPNDVAYQAAINAGTLSAEDAKAIYWKILNHKNTKDVSLSSQYPLITDSYQKLVYADMVVTLGMQDANALYNKAQADVRSFENAGGALMRYYSAALLAQTWVNDPATAKDNGVRCKTQASADFARESYLNRLDVLDKYGLYNGQKQTDVMRELMLDCRTATQLDAIATTWNVDPAVITQLSPDWQTTGVVRVPIMLRKLYGDAEVFTGKNTAAMDTIMAQEYPAAGGQYRFIESSQTQGKHYNLLLPVAGRYDAATDVMTVVVGLPTTQHTEILETQTAETNPPEPSDVSRVSGVYEVAAKDTLSAIARTNNVTVEQLRDWNPCVRETDTIEVGQKLSVSANIHVVQPKETLYSIATNRNVNLDKMRALNPAITSSNTIEPAQVLILPLK